MPPTADPEVPVAVVLLSGGLDSATCLAVARADGFAPVALSFRYGQRHAAELHAAARIATAAGVEHLVVDLDLAALGGSALTDPAIDVPRSDTAPPGRGTGTGADADIPVTYVPARNTVFLAHALAVAEVRGAADLYIGVNAVDYSGYPDCRPAFIAAFETMANLATAAAIGGRRLHVHAPLQHLSKADIVTLARTLDVPVAETVSCYLADDDGAACGRCEACWLRRRGFADAGVTDPTRYALDAPVAP